MIETKMPKDIRSYKTKFIGPFTMRQILCIAIMAAVDIILYILVIQPLKLPMEFIVYGLIFVDVPIGAFGWIEPQGIPLEKYLIDVILRSFIAPAKRKPKKMIYVNAPENSTEKASHKKGKNRKRTEKKGMKRQDEPISFK